MSRHEWDAIPLSSDWSFFVGEAPIKRELTLPLREIKGESWESWNKHSVLNI
jgi:hypothetical protein